MSSNRAPIKYMGFWDVPLIFITRHRGEIFLFDCPFDEELDDYSESYKVYTLPDLGEQELPKDWTTLHRRATQYLGEIPVSRVHFDPSKRQAVDVDVLEELFNRKAAAG
jgi:hypothetical protein